jgi:hypothetical protein
MENTPLFVNLIVSTGRHNLHRHGLVLFVIVPGMTLRSLFLAQLPLPLAVNHQSASGAACRCVLPKYPTHVMEHSCCGEKRGGIAEAIHVVDEKLCVNISLCC